MAKIVITLFSDRSIPSFDRTFNILPNSIHFKTDVAIRQVNRSIRITTREIIIELDCLEIDDIPVKTKLNLFPFSIYNPVVYIRFISSINHVIVSTLSKTLSLDRPKDRSFMYIVIDISPPKAASFYHIKPLIRSFMISFPSRSFSWIYFSRVDTCDNKSDNSDRIRYKNKYDKSDTKIEINDEPRHIIPHPPPKSIEMATGGFGGKAPATPDVAAAYEDLIGTTATTVDPTDQTTTTNHIAAASGDLSALCADVNPTPPEWKPPRRILPPNIPFEYMNNQQRRLFLRHQEEEEVSKIENGETITVITDTRKNKIFKFLSKYPQALALPRDEWEFRCVDVIYAYRYCPKPKKGQKGCDENRREVVALINEGIPIEMAENWRSYGCDDEGEIDEVSDCFMCMKETRVSKKSFSLKLKIKENKIFVSNKLETYFVHPQDNLRFIWNVVTGAHGLLDRKMMLELKQRKIPMVKHHTPNFVNKTGVEMTLPPVPLKNSEILKILDAGAGHYKRQRAIIGKPEGKPLKTNPNTLISNILASDALIDEEYDPMMTAACPPPTTRRVISNDNAAASGDLIREIDATLATSTVDRALPPPTSSRESIGAAVEEFETDDLPPPSTTRRVIANENAAASTDLIEELEAILATSLVDPALPPPTSSRESVGAAVEEFRLDDDIISVASDQDTREYVLIQSDDLKTSSLSPSTSIDNISLLSGFSGFSILSDVPETLKKKTKTERNQDARRRKKINREKREKETKEEKEEDKKRREEAEKKAEEADRKAEEERKKAERKAEEERKEAKRKEKEQEEIIKSLQKKMEEERKAAQEKLERELEEAELRAAQKREKEKKEDYDRKLEEERKGQLWLQKVNREANEAKERMKKRAARLEKEEKEKAAARKKEKEKEKNTAAASGDLAETPPSTATSGDLAEAPPSTAASEDPAKAPPSTAACGDLAEAPPSTAASGDLSATDESVANAGAAAAAESEPRPRLRGCCSVGENPDNFEPMQVVEAFDKDGKKILTQLACRHGIEELTERAFLYRDNSEEAMKQQPFHQQDEIPRVILDHSEIMLRGPNKESPCKCMKKKLKISKTLRERAENLDERKRAKFLEARILNRKWCAVVVEKIKHDGDNKCTCQAEPELPKIPDGSTKPYKPKPNVSTKPDKPKRPDVSTKPDEPKTGLRPDIEFEKAISPPIFPPKKAKKRAIPSPREVTAVQEPPIKFPKLKNKFKIPSNSNSHPDETSRLGVEGEHDARGNYPERRQAGAGKSEVVSAPRHLLFQEPGGVPACIAAQRKGESAFSRTRPFKKQNPKPIQPQNFKEYHPFSRDLKRAKNKGGRGARGGRGGLKTNFPNKSSKTPNTPTTTHKEIPSLLDLPTQPKKPVSTSIMDRLGKITIESRLGKKITRPSPTETVEKTTPNPTRKVEAPTPTPTPTSIPTTTTSSIPTPTPTPTKKFEKIVYSSLPEKDDDDIDSLSDEYGTITEEGDELNLGF